MELKIRRVYDPPGAADGLRVLVDRYWPRGLSKERARVDLWLREAAPSDDLRRWYAHDPQKWTEFRKRYFDELRGRGDLLGPIREHRGPVTLLFASREERINNAAALKEYIDEGAAAARQRR